MLEEVEASFIGENCSNAIKALGVLEGRLWKFGRENGKEKGKSLVSVLSQLFHEKTGKYRFPFLEDDEEQKGMFFIYQDIIKSLRNRTDHDPFKATRNEALQIIGLWIIF